MRNANWRRDPFNKTFNAVERVDIFKVPTNKICRLTETPLYSSIAADRVKVYLLSDLTALTESFADVPAANQYTVDYIPDPFIPAIEEREGTDTVYINVTTGTWVIVKYQGIGRNNWEFDDQIDAALPFGLYKEKREELYDYRLMTVAVNQTYYPHASIFYNNIFYLVYHRTGATTILLTGAAGNSNRVTMPTVTNGQIYNVAPRNDNRFLYFLESTGRLGVFFTDTGNAYRGRISTAALNLADLTAWGDITFPENFLQYACSCQVGNQLFVFGANPNLNTPKDVAVKYDVDTQAGVVLTSLPNNWQFGAAAYDGNGNIYLLGNTLAGREGQVLKYSILGNSYTAMTTISLPIGGETNSTTQFWGAIPDRGAILNRTGEYFILVRDLVTYVTAPLTAYQSGCNAYGNNINYKYTLSGATSKYMAANNSQAWNSPAGAIPTLSTLATADERAVFETTVKINAVTAVSERASRTHAAGEINGNIFCIGQTTQGAASLLDIIITQNI